MPADGGPPPEVVSLVEPEKDDDEQPQTLLQLLSENLSLSFLSRSRADTSDRESREWDRLVVGYLCLLSQWLWEDPKAVKEFLEAGGLGVVSCFCILVIIMFDMLPPTVSRADQPDFRSGRHRSRFMLFPLRRLLRV